MNRIAATRRTVVGALTGVGVLAGLFAGGVAGASDAAAAVASPSTRPVVSANDFLDSVGINVHTYYNDTAYGDTDRVQSLLQGLGVRHIRDGLMPNRPDEVAVLKKLGGAGIRSLLILGNTKNAATQSVDPAQLAALADVRPYVDAVEPTNEYDCSGDASWAAHQRAYSQALVDALQARDDFRSLGVVASSFCRPESVAQFGSADGLASVSNAHDYANGEVPELALDSRLPDWANTQNASLPMAMTETGYHNALNAPSPAQGVTEQTAADYTVRTLLEAKRLGVARTYLYELMDEKPETALRDPEQHFGLVRQDGTVKPAYTAVRNLLGDLAQGSPAAVRPGAARTDVTSVRGGGSLLRSLSVADPTGGGETLALWLATPLENAGHDRLTDTARNVRVQVSGTHTATTRQPSRDNGEVSLGSGDAFTVPVDGGVTLLHLAPTTTTAATASCTAQPGYAALAGQLGALTTNDLSGWTGAAATSSPDGVATGAQVTTDGQQKRVPVPGKPTSWTIALWQRTDAATTNFATFARAVGASGPAAGGLLRTYDTVSDAPSHMQLSGYGLPAGSAGYGSETFGQALPGGWHLVSLAVNGSTATIAVDGVPAGTVASGSGALTGVDVGSLGGSYRGALAGLAVFGRALGSDDLARLATTSPGSCLNSAAADRSTTTGTTTTSTTKTTTSPSSTSAVAKTAVTKAKPAAKPHPATKATSKAAHKKAKKIKKAKKAAHKSKHKKHKH